MAIYNLAGHNNQDSGATNGTLIEAEETKTFRNIVNNYINGNKYKLINDNDNDSLKTMLSKLKPGTGSVCIEWHFDSADNETANGTTAYIDNNSTELSKQMANEITKEFSKILNNKNRGVKYSTESNRKSLAMPKMNGTTALIEIEYISNNEAMKTYKRNINKLAETAAKIMMEYDDKIQ